MHDCGLRELAIDGVKQSEIFGQTIHVIEMRLAAIKTRSNKFPPRSFQQHEQANDDPLRCEASFADLECSPAAEHLINESSTGRSEHLASNTSIQAAEQGVQLEVVKASASQASFLQGRKNAQSGAPRLHFLSGKAARGGEAKVPKVPSAPGST